MTWARPPALLNSPEINVRQARPAGNSLRVRNGSPATQYHDPNPWSQLYTRKTTMPSNGTKYVLTAALVLAGCDGNTTGPISDIPTLRSSSAALHGGTIAASVTGAAQFTNDQGVYRRMEMSATKDADGIVSGTMQWVAGSAIIKASISCLTVIDKTAWVGGVVASSMFTTVPVGSEFYMAIVDHDEGLGVQDQTTARPFLKPAGSAQTFCDAAATPTGLFSMDNGNIRVEGS